MGQGLRILVADHDADALQAAAGVLRCARHDVIEASSATACVETARAQRPDVVLLSASLSDSAGPELCRQIKSDAPSQPPPFIILMLGPNGSADPQAQKSSDDADACLRLPLIEKELLAHIRTAARVRTAERALRQNEDYWRATFDSSVDAIMILDGEHRIVKANARAVASLNTPGVPGQGGAPAVPCLMPEHITGRRCYSLMHGTECPVGGCPHGGAMTGKREEAEIHEPRTDSWLAVVADPITDDSGKVTGIVHTVRDITARKRAELALAERQRSLEIALAEIKELRDRLHEENVYLREEVKVLHSHSEIIGQSQAIRRALSQIEQVAATHSTVLLLGETGTGKELLAMEIHELSARRQHPMVKVNCAALPAALIESELFGREKGAYTGALTRQIGRFELADKSTIFLDEVGELPADLQAKLLRVLESGEIERLGSPKTFRVDVRIIAATNRDLTAEVREGRFRQDLFYRLNVFPITVPPLRQRVEDIPLLVRAFVREFSRSTGKKIESVSKRSLDALSAYSWPGNIRELRNAVERAMIVCDGLALHIDIGGLAPRGEEGVGGAAADEPRTLEQCQRQHVLKTLQRTHWRIRGAGGAAELLDMKPTTLESLMSRLDIHRNGAASEIS